MSPRNVAHKLLIFFFLKLFVKFASTRLLVKYLAGYLPHIFTYQLSISCKLCSILGMLAATLKENVTLVELLYNELFAHTISRQFTFNRVLIRLLMC